MIPAANIAHHSPGRTRIRVPSMKNDSAYFAETSRILQGMGGVKGLSVNPQTGSILLRHDLSLDELTRRAEDKLLFQFLRKVVGHSGRLLRESAAGKLSNSQKALNGGIKEATHGKVDLRTLTAVGLFGLSVLQFRNGKFLPAGMVLALQAVDLLKNGTAGLNQEMLKNGDDL